MFKSFLSLAALGAAVLFPASQASAHVTLAVHEAPVASYYKAVLKVPHGCDGSPTIALRVRIPEGVISVKPQHKPGWKIQTTKGDYAQSYVLHGGKIESGVKEIAWTGSVLPDEEYDEFAFVAYLASDLKPGGMLYFPVVQECEKGVARWIDVPDGHAKGSDTHEDTPAPGLKLLPPQ
ncbi:DUF1775 domain-containing protein [Allopusillimonas soli]|uniref:DUF1775 domain-containing protein n=1 Tax=Allopusillimonas soli TaxID=659016 RepID=A0A853F690_9BURK|nr:DUF1775 domain-containing protein [Allopusillimonas soli]NYT35358.1 DUF1775 domain-containing protein [Allopusillimonas soli]TEA75777.1 DUF1775 domain-containing protein [Allopusillimonas soli]